MVPLGDGGGDGRRDGDGGRHRGDAGAMALDLDLDNVDLLDQHPSTIAGRGTGAR